MSDKSSELSFPDEDLVRFANCGQDWAVDELFERYKNFVRARARSYFLIGADKEDIIQEGMIGLYKAIRDFNADRQASFCAFAELCVTRQMITAVKTATRQKHIPLNSYISLNKPVYEDDSERTLLDMLVSGKSQNPEELLISRENYQSVEDAIGKTLSKYERSVLDYYLSGMSYSQIAEKFGKNEKSIDNALQRVKRKLDRYIKTCEEVE